VFSVERESGGHPDSRAERESGDRDVEAGITAEEPLLAEIKAFLQSVRDGRVRWFRWRMGGERWSWGWRYWQRLNGTRDGSGGERLEVRGQRSEVRLQR